MKRKCKICGSRFETPYLNRYWCDDDCRKEYLAEQYTKQREKALQKVAEKRNSSSPVQKTGQKIRSDLTKKVQSVFNHFIRLRDENLPCISCGTTHAVWHAGHYRTIGAAPELRFNELNVNKQCERCNVELSGNIKGYRQGLIEKYGLEKVEWLEGSHAAAKRTESDLRELLKKYQRLVKEMQ